GVDGQQRGELFDLLGAHAVLDRPPNVAAQSRVGAALSDQAGQHDHAPLAQREGPLVPRTPARRGDRLAGHPIADQRTKVRGDLALGDPELARVRGQAASASGAVGVAAHAGTTAAATRSISLATSSGVSIIEKCVRASSRPTEYQSCSSANRCCASRYSAVAGCPQRCLTTGTVGKADNARNGL